MKGGREILLSFGVGLVTITALIQMRTHLEKSMWYQEMAPPVQGQAQFKEESEPETRVKADAQALRTAPNAGREVVVAIIDTGCDVHHPDLAANLWTNPGETGLDENGMSKATNGIDDDDDGLVDDVHGWNFTENSADLTDNHGHGTHIAGIIAKQTALFPGVKLMVVKYFGTEASGPDNLKFTIQAIRYAVRKGANIINYSGGGLLKSSEEESALSWARSQGVLVVAAAGNEGLNSDFFHFYPADYELDNILSVGATNRDGDILPMSNYGLHTVDLLAPGKNIYSTLPNGQYGYMSGTSQATAFASAAAAMVLSQNPNLHDPARLIHLLIETGTKLSALQGKSYSGTWLNAQAAIDQAPLENPRISRDRQPARTADAQ
jgi:thermitase